MQLFVGQPKPPELFVGQYPALDPVSAHFPFLFVSHDF
jgi:hypothetical protein